MSGQAKETLPHAGMRDGRSFGWKGTLGTVDCPFCSKAVKCYRWSLANGGKKCSCGAILFKDHATK